MIWIMMEILSPLLSYIKKTFPVQAKFFFNFFETQKLVGERMIPGILSKISSKTEWCLFLLLLLFDFSEFAWKFQFPEQLI